MSGEPFQLDNLIDPSTLLVTDSAMDTSSFYLPSFFCTDDSDLSYSPTMSPDDLMHIPGDCVSMPTCVSPVALSPEAASGSPPVLLFEQQSPIAKEAERRQSPTPAENGMQRSSRRSSSTTSGSERRRRSSNNNTSSAIAASPASPKLRSSKRSKATKKSPPSPAEDLPEDRRKARHSHNLVEKRYREHLNQQFERLLSALLSTSQGNDGDSNGPADQPENLSKAAVLDLARRTIQSLADEKRSLAQQIAWLKQRGAAANVNIESLPEMMAW